MSWHFNIDADVQVAMPVTLDIFYPFAFQAKHGARLSAGRDFNTGFAIQRGNLDLSSQRGLDKTDWHFAKQIIAVALKNCVRFNMDDDKQIAGRSASETGLPISYGTQA